MLPLNGHGAVDSRELDVNHTDGWFSPALSLSSKEDESAFCA